MSGAPNLDVVRRELQLRRARTADQVAGLAARPARGMAPGFGKRIGDGTIEAVSRLTDIGVGGSLEVTLRRIERALAKLDDGSYGTCDQCGGAIAAARLAAMPESTLCLTCAAAQRRVVPRR